MIVATVSTLDALIPSTSTLSPVFNAGVLSYTVQVPKQVSSIRIAPALTDPLGRVTVKGLTTTSGSNSAAIGLRVGANTIPVVVYAQNRQVSTTYTVTVNRVACMLFCVYLDVFICL